MSNRGRSRKVLVACRIAAFICVLSCLVSCGNGPSSSDNGNPGSKREDGQAPRGLCGAEKPTDTVLKGVVNELVRHGWDKESAQAVALLNADWHRLLKADNEDAFQAELGKLMRIGGQKKLMTVIKQHPEAAGLIAGAENPEVIARALSSSPDYETAANLFVLYPTPEDAEAIAEAFIRNRDLITGLNGRCLMGSEIIFMFNRRGRGSDDYEQWVREVVSEGLRGSDQDLVSIVVFLLDQGRLIRERMAFDDVFRKRFQKDLWPKLVRICTEKKEPLTYYLWDSRIWDVLLLPEGEALVRKWGLLPAGMLFGDKSYPKDLHHRVAQILLRTNDSSATGLAEFRSDPLFYGLVRRRLTDNCLEAAVNKLCSMKEQGEDYASELKKYGPMTDAGLCEEMKEYFGLNQGGAESWIPLYNVYVVGKKLSQGRDPSAGDILWAGFDAALFWVGPLQGGRIFVSAAKTEGGALRTTLSKRAFSSLEQRVGRKALERVIKGGGTGAKERLERSLVPQASSLGWSESAGKIRTLLSQKMACDITGPVQFVFKHSKAGCNTFKRVTGLDARLFMRGDARVVIYPVKLIPHPIAAYLRETCTQMGLFGVTESPPGRDIAGAAKETAAETIEELTVWRKHVSAWWLVNAADPSPNRDHALKR